MTVATFEASLFEHLNTLFSGSSTVRDFRHWFSNASWDSGKELPDELYELASDIEHFGYIVDSGVWDAATYVQNVKTEVDAFCAASARSSSTTAIRDRNADQCEKIRVA